MRRRERPVPATGSPPAEFVPARWLGRYADVEPALRRVYARRAYDAAWSDWGRKHGFDPDAAYATAEGRRWHEFRHGVPAAPS